MDIALGDRRFGPASRAALQAAVGRGSLIACEVVWTELAAVFPTPEDATATLFALDVTFAPMTQRAAEAAGGMWSEYRRVGGPRTRVVADFLIAAHASVHADALLTRDRGFARTHFGDLTIIDPSVEA